MRVSSSGPLEWWVSEGTCCGRVSPLVPFGQSRSEKRSLIRGWNKLCAQQPEPSYRVPPQPVSGFQPKTLSQPHTTNQQRFAFSDHQGLLFFIFFLFQQFISLFYSLLFVLLSSPFSSSGNNLDTHAKAAVNRCLGVGEKIITFLTFSEKNCVGQRLIFFLFEPWPAVMMLHGGCLHKLRITNLVTLPRPSCDLQGVATRS
ncbi:hypothetical protein L873DRAFT_1131088 [Choiromyces venosus 120613-1]|uniref:Uncharacterized protein n=1 Tax=Choiromyces venosus 120613-1 TaxID=1336337 RepID=A0A3N4JLU5_9PEZI|nr:hypothetical protein L873DRAFT_1131088 [Choiromyces venosus 120613-1]